MLKNTKVTMKVDIKNKNIMSTFLFKTIPNLFENKVK